MHIHKVFPLLSSSYSSIFKGSLARALFFVALVLTLTLSVGPAEVQAQDGGTVTTGPCEEPTEFDPRFFGLWRELPSSDEWKVYNSWASLESAQQQATRSLVDIETYVEDEERLYAALWRSDAGTGGEVLSNDLGWHAFTFTQTNKEAEGYGLADLEVQVSQNDVRFLAVWRMGAASVDLVLHNSRIQFAGEIEARKSSQSLVELEVWNVDSERWYFAAFRFRLRNDPLQIFRVNQDWCYFHDDYHGLESSHRLQDFEVYYDTEGIRRYTSAWTAESGRDHLWIGYLESAFSKADERIVQDEPGLVLYDFEVLDDGSDWSEPNGNNGQMHNPNETIGWNHPGFFPSGGDAVNDLGDITRDDGNGTIVGAPPLHDTGSSGPD